MNESPRQNDPDGGRNRRTLLHVTPTKPQSGNADREQRNKSSHHTRPSLEAGGLSIKFSFLVGPLFRNVGCPDGVEPHARENLACVETEFLQIPHEVVLPHQA